MQQREQLLFYVEIGPYPLLAGLNLLCDELRLGGGGCDKLMNSRNGLEKGGTLGGKELCEGTGEN